MVYDTCMFVLGIIGFAWLIVATVINDQKEYDKIHNNQED